MFPRTLGQDDSENKSEDMAHENKICLNLQLSIHKNLHVGNSGNFDHFSQRSVRKTSQLSIDMEAQKKSRIP